MKTIIIDGIEYNLTPKVLFKKGDWVVYDHRPYQVVELPKEGYINLGLKGNGKIEFAPSTYCKHWAIEDAKAGDVLVYCNEISIYKDIIKACTENDTKFGGFTYYCCYDGNLRLNSLYSLTSKDEKNIHPATKEQRDQLEKAMADAGYTFDFEKKELKKIEQKSSWSEEDERMYRGLHNLIYSTPYCDSRKELSDWLKSLRTQNRWKPSENELEVLRLAAEKDGACLMGLYQQLKKLRGE